MLYKDLTFSLDIRNEDPNNFGVLKLEGCKVATMKPVAKVEFDCGRTSGTSGSVGLMDLDKLKEALQLMLTKLEKQ